jgi:serine/threonine protein kinase
VKISDFGFSKTIEQKNGCRTLCGTPGYLAPEILERWPAYDTKCDVWSFGVILFLLLGGYLPFDAQGSNDVNQVFERTRNGQYQFFPKRWNTISALAKDMVAKCLTVNSNKRMDAKAALKHEWMTEGQRKSPTRQLSTSSLAETVQGMEVRKKAHEEKEKQRKRKKKVSFWRLQFTWMSYIACSS